MFALIQKKQTTFDAIKGHNNDTTGVSTNWKGASRANLQKNVSIFFLSNYL